MIYDMIEQIPTRVNARIRRRVSYFIVGWCSSVSVPFFISRLWGHVWRVRLDSFQRVDCYLAAHTAKRVTVFWFLLYYA